MFRNEEKASLVEIVRREPHGPKAVHESAHAIVAWAHGQRLQCARLDRVMVLDHESVPAKARLAIARAGAAGEQRAGVENPTGCGRDRQEEEVALAELIGDLEGAAAEQRRADLRQEADETVALMLADQATAHAHLADFMERNGKGVREPGRDGAPWDESQLVGQVEDLWDGALPAGLAVPPDQRGTDVTACVKPATRLR